MGDEHLVSNTAFERIVNLLSKGYEVRVIPVFHNEIQIRISKNGINAAHFISIEEVKQIKIDYMLYTINRLVELVDEGVERSKF